MLMVRARGPQGRGLGDQRLKRLGDPIVATQAQIEANRRNAQKSTGPKTEAGKSRVRENALTHGLTASPNAVTPELFRAAREYWNDLVIDHEPRGRYQRLLLSEAALALAQLERLPVVREYHRALDQERAVNSWNQDRSDEAGRIGARLRRQPSRTIERLGRTAHGVAWMITRWRTLHDTLEAGDTWSEDQREMAQALLGLDPELRTASSRIGVETPVEELKRLTAAELERWSAFKAERLDRLDELERQLAISGAAFDDSPAARRFHRYERDCYKKLNGAFANLRQAQATRGEWDDGGDSATWVDWPSHEDETPAWAEALQEYQAIGEFDWSQLDANATPAPDASEAQTSEVSNAAPEPTPTTTETAAESEAASTSAETPVEPVSAASERPAETASEPGVEKQSQSTQERTSQAVETTVEPVAPAPSRAAPEEPPRKGLTRREKRRARREAERRAAAQPR